MYRLEPGMTVIQAVARAGGITVRGSDRRIEIKRPAKDGKYEIIHAKPDDVIAADDVIRVKESIF
jgi:polysaccharide export outer membrane protein